VQLRAATAMRDSSAAGPFGAPGAPEAADRAWFADAITPVVPQLYATARRLTRHAADAEDLVAEAVAQAWRRRQTLHDRGAFRTWMFRILTNAFVSARRAARARPATESIDELEDADESFSLFERLHQPFLLWWGSPEQEFLNKLLREDLERAISALPESFRLAIILADVQGLSYQEIAVVLRIPIGTVRSRLARGRAALQEALWQHAVDAGLVPQSKPRQGDAHD